MTHAVTNQPAKAEAIRHVEQALAICDALGLDIAGCHLQMGLDLMLGWSRDQTCLGEIDPH